MKKLIDFIKTKEKVNTAPSEKKAYPKAEKEITASTADEKTDPKDLFWDDYSDIGYC